MHYRAPYYIAAQLSGLFLLPRIRREFQSRTRYIQRKIFHFTRAVTRESSVSTHGLVIYSSGLFCEKSNISLVVHERCWVVETCRKSIDGCWIINARHYSWLQIVQMTRSERHVEKKKFAVINRWFALFTLKIGVKHARLRSRSGTKRSKVNFTLYICILVVEGLCDSRSQRGKYVKPCPLDTCTDQLYFELINGYRRLARSRSLCHSNTLAALDTRNNWCGVCHPQLLRALGSSLESEKCIIDVNGGHVLLIFLYYFFFFFFFFF